MRLYRVLDHLEDALLADWMDTLPSSLAVNFECGQWTSAEWYSQMPQGDILSACFRIFS